MGLKAAASLLNHRSVKSFSFFAHVIDQHASLFERKVFRNHANRRRKEHHGVESVLILGIIEDRTNECGSAFVQGQ